METQEKTFQYTWTSFANASGGLGAILYEGEIQARDVELRALSDGGLPHAQMAVFHIDSDEQIDEKWVGRLLSPKEAQEFMQQYD